MAGQYELKRIRKGLRVNLAGGKATRQEVTATLTGSPGAILIGIPLVEVPRGSTPGQSTRKPGEATYRNLLGIRTGQPYFWGISRGSKG